MAKNTKTAIDERKEILGAVSEKRVTRFIAHGLEFNTREEAVKHAASMRLADLVAKAVAYHEYQQVVNDFVGDHAEVLLDILKILVNPTANITSEKE